MLVYLLIFAAIIFFISALGFIELLKDDKDEPDVIAFFGSLTAASGTAVGFCIALLANS